MHQLLAVKCLVHVVCQRHSHLLFRPANHTLLIACRKPNVKCDNRQWWHNFEVVLRSNIDFDISPEVGVEASIVFDFKFVAIETEDVGLNFCSIFV